jgi:hypothetical protein
MTIRFSCGRCNGVHQVPDHLAGTRARCGRCGNQMVVLAVAVATASLGLPMFPKAAERPWGSIAGGMIAGLAVVFVVFAYRDNIVSVAPGLAPLLPPKAAPRKIAARPNAPDPQFDAVAVIGASFDPAS